MLEAYRGRSGSLTASWNGRQLHSAFRPENEAERFIARELPAPPRTVVVIGPGLGYLGPAIRKRNPVSRVIAIFLSSECRRHAVDRGTAWWDPDTGASIDSFLLSVLDELAEASIAVLEWPPAAECFAREARVVRNALSVVLQRSHASLLTEGANGRRWLSNLLRNFTAMGYPVAPSGSRDGSPAGTGVSACVIAAAGPTLEESLDVIEKVRSRVSLWVVGSALEAVTARGMDPDLVVTTDAAPYATEYLRSAVAGERVVAPVAAPLTASRGFVETLPVWPISGTDLLEDTLYRRLPDPPVTVPSHGTVTGTAFQLARGLSGWPIVFAGLDFGWRDTRSHVRPHVAWTYRFGTSSRFLPADTETYRSVCGLKRVSDTWRSEDSLQVYARWFADAATERSTTVYRLNPSPLASEIPAIDERTLKGLPLRFATVTFGQAHWPNPRERLDIVRELITEIDGVLESVTRTEQDPTPLQSLLLRRLSLDAMIRWRQHGDREDLRTAARTARAIVADIAGAYR